MGGQRCRATCVSFALSRWNRACITEIGRKSLNPTATRFFPRLRWATRRTSDCVFGIQERHDNGRHSWNAAESKHATESNDACAFLGTRGRMNHGTFVAASAALRFWKRGRGLLKTPRESRNVGLAMSYNVSPRTRPLCWLLSRPRRASGLLFRNAGWCLSTALRGRGNTVMQGEWTLFRMRWIGVLGKSSNGCPGYGSVVSEC